MPLTTKQNGDKHWELMQSKGCKVIPAPAAYNKRLRQERMIMLERLSKRKRRSDTPQKYTQK